MTDNDFAQLLAIGYERQGIEFKAPGPLTDKHLAALVAKAMLGMANHRDGGHIVIGVNDMGNRLDPVGLAHDDLDTWSNDDSRTINPL
jgi:predicted HTH transcriptional regulator